MPHATRHMPHAAHHTPHATHHTPHTARITPDHTPDHTTPTPTLHATPTPCLEPDRPAPLRGVQRQGREHRRPPGSAGPRGRRRRAEVPRGGAPGREGPAYALNTLAWSNQIGPRFYVVGSCARARASDQSTAYSIVTASYRWEGCLPAVASRFGLSGDASRRRPGARRPGRWPPRSRGASGGLVDMGFCIFMAGYVWRNYVWVTGVEARCL